MFVIAFTGVRGAVSLAAALALPLTLPSGDGFPHRDLILFVAFGVIFVTLVGTGLLLPPVVRWLGVAQDGRSEHLAEHEAELAARREALAAALQSLDAMTDDRELSEEVVKLLRARHETRTKPAPCRDRPRPRYARRLRRRYRPDARADRGRTKIHPRAAARRQDHRRNAAADRARPRSGGSESGQPGISARIPL